MWVDFVVGIVVISLLVILMGPGLWSSRLSINKDDAKKDGPKPPNNT